MTLSTIVSFKPIFCFQNKNVLYKDCIMIGFCFPTELFSKPRLTVEPIDIFEGDKFRLTCSVSIYVPEKINNETMRFSIYQNNLKLANGDTYSAVAHPYKNGNYTCKAQAASLVHSFVKESQTVVVEAKGKSSSAWNNKNRSKRIIILSQ